MVHSYIAINSEVLISNPIETKLSLPTETFQYIILHNILYYHHCPEPLADNLHIANTIIENFVYYLLTISQT